MQSQHRLDFTLTLAQYAKIRRKQTKKMLYTRTQQFWGGDVDINDTWDKKWIK
jgi:hypothetical protein